jgi:hypothetical protein
LAAEGWVGKGRKLLEKEERREGKNDEERRRKPILRGPQRVIEAIGIQ